jgi:hypothetical protein
MEKNCNPTTNVSIRVTMADRSLSNRSTWQNNGADTQHLLAWMTMEGNYSRYQGKNNTGEKKARIATKLAEEMKLLGCSRTGKDVQNKISYWVTKFKTAQEYINGTGSGVEANDAGTFEATVKGKFLFYYELLPILGSRSGVKPPSTNESTGYLQSVGKFGTSNNSTVAMNACDTQTEIAIETINDISNTANTVTEVSPSMMQHLGVTKQSGATSNQSRRNSKGTVAERTKNMAIMTEQIRKDAEETEKKKRQKLDVEMELCELDKKAKELEMKSKMEDEEVKEGERFLARLNQYNELKKTFTDEQIVAKFPKMKEFCN